MNNIIEFKKTQSNAVKNNLISYMLDCMNIFHNDVILEIKTNSEDSFVEFLHEKKKRIKFNIYSVKSSDDYSKIKQKFNKIICHESFILFDKVKLFEIIKLSYSKSFVLFPFISFSNDILNINKNLNDLAQFNSWMFRFDDNYFSILFKTNNII